MYSTRIYRFTQGMGGSGYYCGRSRSMVSM